MISQHKNQKTNTATSAVFSVFIVLAVLALNAETPRAQALDIIPAVQSDAPLPEDEVTHPPIRLTPDKSVILKLDQDISRLFVGNPAHLNVLADSSKTLVLVARAPGATHFTALDKDGNIIMQRYVLVAAPKENYVRVRNTCQLTEEKGCQDTQVYYCPDMCHQIMLNTEDPAGDSGNPATATADPGAGSPAVDTQALQSISDSLNE